MESSLNSNIVNTSFANIDFANDPQTYVSGGSLRIEVIGKICILTFVDIVVRNSPANNTAIISSPLIPTAKYEVSTLLAAAALNGAQKVHMSGNSNAITNYWTSDSQRGQGYFHGQLMYIIA